MEELLQQIEAHKKDIAAFKSNGAEVSRSFSN